MNFTPHQAKYFALELNRRSASGIDRISQGLSNSKIELNPHQIEGAIFALENPLERGVLLADEVGLGKTIEAGLAMCQLWAEQKRNLLVICPAVLRKQWASELEEKFGIPCLVLDGDLLKKSYGKDFSEFFKENLGKKLIIVSYNYVREQEKFFAREDWHCVVLDEAHKVSNENSKTFKAIYKSFKNHKKILLTATPLQNKLEELFVLSMLLDDHLFGDKKIFNRDFKKSTENIRTRLKTVAKRTLRKDVTEYIRYTQRHAITQSFCPSDAEMELYTAISEFLSKPESIAIPKRGRHLVVLQLRKLLASSTQALHSTLKIMLERLYALRDQNQDQDFLTQLENQEEDLSQQLHSDMEDRQAFGVEKEAENDAMQDEKGSLADFDPIILQEEIALLESFIKKSETINQDSKAVALIDALKVGFKKISELGALQKAIIFTESVRTQKFLYEFLQKNGYSANDLVCFSGTNNSSEAKVIYTQWLADPNNESRITGSPSVDMRSALIDYFKNSAQIMIATEAGAEGINLQFCSLLINYDLPWNPQRVEQRIGRCHRYGQKFDVVVINFVNKRNSADQRVLELLDEKFQLFNGVFGASDEILGSIGSGIDFEKRILEILDRCRTDTEINQAFDELQKQMEEPINQKMRKAQVDLFNHFDEEVHSHLKLRHDESLALLNKTNRYLAIITQFILQNRLTFNSDQKSFFLHDSPIAEAQSGLYFLEKKDSEQGKDYRLNHPLSQWVIEQSQNLATPTAYLRFNYEQYGKKVSLLEKNRGQKGWLRLDKITFQSQLQTEEKLVLTVSTDNLQPLASEFAEKLLSLPAKIGESIGQTPEQLHILAESNLQQVCQQNEANAVQLLAREFERLEVWADDCIEGITKQMDDLNDQMKQARRERSLTKDLIKLEQLTKHIFELDKELDRLQKKRYAMEAEIRDERDKIFDKIKYQLEQNIQQEHIFTINWELV